MPNRIVFLFVLLLLAPHLEAKNKKRQLLPDDVLRARTVLVVIHSDAGEALTSPMANRTTQDEVERAIMKWGRFDLALDAQTADLVIAVRKGNKSGPVISHSPVDDRPVIFQTGGGGVRVAEQQGHPPDLTNPVPGGLGNTGPQLGTQIGSSEDTFEVYRGGIKDPLDTSPVWRYIAKDAESAASRRSRAVPEGN